MGQPSCIFVLRRMQPRRPARSTFKETPIYFVWRICFTFFATVEDGRVHSCFKKRSRLANQNTSVFQRLFDQCLPKKEHML